MSREQRLLIEEELKAGPPPGGGRDQLARARHRHGRRRPGDPGRVAAVGGAAACSASAGPATTSARSAAAWCSPSSAATSSSAPWSSSGCGTAPIEALRYPRNPLDVLAQQIVAMVRDGRLDGRRPATDWCAGAAPFAELPRQRPGGVLDMLAGRYPVRRVRGAPAADELGPGDRPADARGRARSVWPSPRAARSPTAACSACSSPARRAPRVGELDEEMVYESRVGDVFVLGASSWRIEDITHDRVLVTPAPGARARCRSGTATRSGRPVELGRALGAFVRELGRADAGGRAARLRAAGLDEFAAANLLAVPRRAARGDRRAARRPDHRGRALPRRAGRLARLRPLAVRSARPRPVGAGDRGADPRAPGARGPDDVHGRRDRRSAPGGRRGTARDLGPARP